MQRHRKSPLGAAARGFTLIELLTVIAIIGILAAIIIPVTGSVRKRARATVAMSNIRQLVAGQLAYSLDNKGLFAPTYGYSRPDGGPQRTWMLRLAPYVLPSATDSAKLDAQRAARLTVYDMPEAERATTYDKSVGMNWQVAAYTNVFGMGDYTLAKIPRPMSIIMLGEMFEANSDTVTAHDRSSRGLNGAGTPGFRRDGDRAMMGFYDGRVKAMTIDELAYNGKTTENNPWWWK